MNRQREQGTPGHVHLFAGQLLRLHIYREGIGQLNAELQTFLFRQADEPFQHRDCILPLQILLKVVIIESNIVVAQAVKALSCIFISQQRRVALDIGIQMFLGDQVGCDAFDLVRRTSVQRRFCHGSGDPGGDSPDISFIHFPEPAYVCKRPVDAFLKLRSLSGIDHLIQERIDLFGTDAFQVITDRHIENKSVRITESEFLCQKFTRYPGFYIFRISLRNIQFCGPFAVIAFIVRRDAGFADTCGQFGSVHDLYGLQFEEPGAGRIGSYDILRKLRIRSRSRPEGCLDLLLKDRESLSVFMLHDLCYAKNPLFLFILLQDPVH